MADEVIPAQTSGAEEAAAGVMSLRDHLLELRKRVTIAAFSVLIASLLVWPFKDAVFAILQAPLPRGAVLQQIAVTETLFTFMKISIIVGFGLASPVVVYQILAFVAPGLFPNERKWLYMSIPAVSIAFLIGAAFAWFIVLRFTVGFLASFAPRSISTQFTVDGWVTFVLRILLAVGLAFETPFVIFALAKIGLVKASTLARQRRYAVVVIVIVAAIITPTPDPFTQMSVAIPLYALYEIGVVLARVAVPEEKQDEGSESDADGQPAGA